ncbi:type II toxin-antitoxin system RelE/ParE family toxin [Ornithinimicrobium cavernae]|uniref:type II toxin-antitoxin system RelE/ParE family toxin n=1 Tax=Ornithinimicrobium cavernae TaxID=2666047 RepID=UPI0023512A3B|nr:type II toxin-antitoxin system RelE/ParE family toxin [Ornithinimicrobium cavernae]
MVRRPQDAPWSTLRIVLTPHAVGDVEEACDHYAGIDPKLSPRFADDVDAAIERIVMFPRGAPAVDGFDKLRRARMRRFPYGIFYQQTPTGDLLVVRVLHSRRHYPDALEG